MNVLDVVPTTKFRIKHLRSNHAYAFVVRAENFKGIGLPSSVSEMTTTKIASLECTFLSYAIFNFNFSLFFN